MRKILILSMLILSACTSDHYTVIPNSAGSQENLDSDLSACKSKVIHQYTDTHSRNAVLGGVLLGPIGAGVGGAMDDANSAGSTMKQSDINPGIQQCMKEKGYSGISKGY